VQYSALITPPNLHIASPLAYKTENKLKYKKINLAFMGLTIVFSVCNKPLNKQIPRNSLEDKCSLVRVFYSCYPKINVSSKTVLFIH
jgi:hypothetical protein